MAYEIDPNYVDDRTTQYFSENIVSELLTAYADKLEEIATFPDPAKYQLYKELNRREAPTE